MAEAAPWIEPQSVELPVEGSSGVEAVISGDGSSLTAMDSSFPGSQQMQ
jgi:hypothetical protein